jgi:hypothetical protein
MDTTERYTHRFQIELLNNIMRGNAVAERRNAFIAELVVSAVAK